jgi:hypothetical protein
MERKKKEGEKNQKEERIEKRHSLKKREQTKCEMMASSARNTMP